MRKAVSFVIAVLAANLLGACGSGSGHQGGGGPLASVDRPTVVTRFAALDSAQETPPNASPAKGAGILSFDSATRRIAGFVVSEGVMGTAAHIHVAARGTAGDILVPLVGGPGVFVVPDDTLLPEGNIGDLAAGNLYFNIHSQAYPEGEIRGQIDLAPEQTRLASLDGAQETPPNASAAKGGGIFALDPETGRVAGFVVSEGVTATAAHVHAAPRGQAGDIVVPLVGGPRVWSVPDGATLPEESRASLEPGNLYYNVHSAALPGGEIRGQLDLAPSWGRLASLDGAQESPPSPSAAKGAGLLGLDVASRRIAGFTVTAGVAGTAAHVHAAARGVPGPVKVPLVGGPGTWVVPDGAVLSQEDVASFGAGNLYYNVHSAERPEGEIRGQLDRP